MTHTHTPAHTAPPFFQFGFLKYILSVSAAAAGWGNRCTFTDEDVESVLKDYSSTSHLPPSHLQLSHRQRLSADFSRASVWVSVWPWPQTGVGLINMVNHLPRSLTAEQQQHYTARPSLPAAAVCSNHITPTLWTRTLFKSHLFVYISLRQIHANTHP